MKKKIGAIGIIAVIFFIGMTYVQFVNKCHEKQSYTSSIERKEMYPLDSLRFKFV